MVPGAATRRRLAALLSCVPLLTYVSVKKYLSSHP